jgi:hypothetical protein
LRQKNANSETIRHQERILSRLLDAQRSLRRQDVSQQRQSVAGKDVFRRSPDIRQQTLNDFQDRMRRDVLRMDEEGYTSDYQELIRQYFESLSKQMK